MARMVLEIVCLVAEHRRDPDKTPWETIIALPLIL